MTETTLTRIKYIEMDGDAVVNMYGFQETDQYGNLLHLYDDNGDQLDNGKTFPNSKFESLGLSSPCRDSDDFWNFVESSRDLRD